MDQITIRKANLQSAMDVVLSHIESLSYPLDSWLEDALAGSEIYVFIDCTSVVGYCAAKERVLQFFYVLPSAYRYAPALFERTVKDLQIEKAMVMTQDRQMCALIAEWEIDMLRLGCWFTDSGEEVQNDSIAQSADLRTAEQGDTKRIREASGDFFDETSGGFTSLEERVDAQTIFVLERGGEMLGCGIIEAGLLCRDYVSIGMFVCPVHRQKGVAKTILLHLKKKVYARGGKPIAGCWYYNTLSRRALESAGMICTALGYEAILKGKDKPPKRTGNPPGELVE